MEFSDIIEIHTLELKKLPENGDGTALYDWAKFIAAESEEELDKAAEKNQEVKKAVVKFRELTADERIRDRFERHEKARRDQDMFLRWELKKRDFEIAKNLLNLGDPIDKIITVTGLTHDEIENLSRGKV